MFSIDFHYIKYSYFSKPQFTILFNDKMEQKQLNMMKDNLRLQLANFVIPNYLNL